MLVDLLIGAQERIFGYRERFAIVIVVFVESLQHGSWVLNSYTVYTCRY
eukprot:SAG31_NODE_633_length_13382_cov_11.528911_4_plen_49_part_00